MRVGARGARERRRRADSYQTRRAGRALTQLHLVLPACSLPAHCVRDTKLERKT